MIVDEPRVELLPAGRGLLLGPGLDGLRDAERDAGQVALLHLLGTGRERRGGRRRDGGGGGHLHDEVQLSAVEAYVDAPLRQLGADLGGGLGDGLHQGEAGARVQGVAEALGHLARLLATRLGRGEEVAAEAVDVRRDVHAHHYDITVTS